MTAPEPAARIVLTTTANHEEAVHLARTLVEERLAACASLLPSVESIYHWQGEIETSRETMIVFKTEAEQIPALEARLQALHSYQTPEFLVLRIETGSQAYLDWINTNLRRDASVNPES
jgi:periplasmic divalent cation tolerance protein